MRITSIHADTVPLASALRNAYINFSQMTASIVAIVTDVVRDGKPVIGFGFNSNGRYGATGLMRERFIPRLLNAPPESLINDAGDNLDPFKAWKTMMTNE